MIKKNFLYASATLILVLGAQTANTAEVTVSAPAQIVVQHAVIKSASGSKQASIYLVATDDRSLHEGQIYQAHFKGANSEKPQDGRYDEVDEEIFIPKLVQSDSVVYQATLRLIDRKTMQFEITETTLLSAESESNAFFDPRAVHNVNNYR